MSILNKSKNKQVIQEVADKFPCSTELTDLNSMSEQELRDALAVANLRQNQSVYAMVNFMFTLQVVFMVIGGVIGFVSLLAVLNQ